MPVREKKTDFQEKRSAVRANRVVAIKHRPIKSSKIPVEWSLSLTKNMSVTGLLFMSKIPYIVGDLLELNVTMSGIIDIIKGHAKVVRVHENGSHSFEVAVKLVDLKTRTRSAKSHLK